MYGETLEYLGSPFELLLGFMIALAALIPVYGGFIVAAFELGPVGELSGLIGFIGLAFLGQYAIYHARRYRCRGPSTAACDFLRPARPGSMRSVRCSGGCSLA